MPDDADPTGFVERQAVRALAVVALTVAAIELLIVVAARVLGDQSVSWREMLTIAEFGWRGAWIGILFLWSIGVAPWRLSGGRIAIILLVVLVSLTFSVVALREFDFAEQIWTLVFGAAVAAWLLAARLFGLRIGHLGQARHPVRLRWSLLTICATVTFFAIVAGIGTAIWRSWLYEREHNRGWFVGLLQLILMVLMAATFLQSVSLLVALRWRWGGYVSLFLGPLGIAAPLATQSKGEVAGAVLFGGFCLLANGIVATVLHYYGWRIFLDTPIWDRPTVKRLNDPSKP